MTPEQTQMIVEMKRATWMNALEAIKPEEARAIILKAYQVYQRYIQAEGIEPIENEDAYGYGASTFLDAVNNARFFGIIHDWFLIHESTLHNEAPQWFRQNVETISSTQRLSDELDEVRAVAHPERMYPDLMLNRAFLDIEDCQQDMYRAFKKEDFCFIDRIKSRGENHLRRRRNDRDDHVVSQQLALESERDKQRRAFIYEQARSLLTPLQESLGRLTLRLSKENGRLSNIDSKMSCVSQGLLDAIGPFLVSFQERRYQRSDYQFFKSAVKSWFSLYPELKAPDSVFPLTQGVMSYFFSSQGVSWRTEMASLEAQFQTVIGELDIHLDPLVKGPSFKA